MPRRPLHPGAWWLWAAGLALAAGRTTNPLLLGLVVAVAGYVVAACRTTAPWARSYATFLKLGVALVLLGVAVRTVLGPGGSGEVVLRLPAVPLPAWLAGLHLGGAVRSGPLLEAAYSGLQLLAGLAAFGAANSLASPQRLLKALPGALYEAGLVVTVALSFAPEAVATAGRLRTARRLRGRPSTGLAALTGIGVPLLGGALDRSLQLAAAMDSRGYGRRAGRSPRERRITGALLLGGLVAVAIGCYGLFDPGAPVALPLPALGGGALLLVAGLLAAGRRTPRSRYRPDRFDARARLVGLSGVVACVAVSLSHGLHPSAQPPAAPELPVAAVVGLLIALLPAAVAGRQR